MTSTEAVTAESQPSSPSDPTDANTSPESPTTTESLIFKAVGIIRGEVNFSDESHADVTINQKQYPLFYSRSRPALSGLRQEIEKTGLSHWREVKLKSKMSRGRRKKSSVALFVGLGREQ